MGTYGGRGLEGARRPEKKVCALRGGWDGDKNKGYYLNGMQVQRNHQLDMPIKKMLNYGQAIFSRQLGPEHTGHFFQPHVAAFLWRGYLFP